MPPRIESELTLKKHVICPWVASRADDVRAAALHAVKLSSSQKWPYTPQSCRICRSSPARRKVVGFVKVFKDEILLQSCRFDTLHVAKLSDFESGPLRAVHLSRHEWPEGLVNQDSKSISFWQTEWFHGCAMNFISKHS